MSQIASLFANLGFTIDTRNLDKFERSLTDTAKKVNRFGDGVRRSTAPVKKQVAGITALQKRYNKLGGALSQVRQDFSKINQAYRAGDISLEKRKRLLTDINNRYRELKRSTDSATYAQKRYNRTPTKQRQSIRERSRSVLPTVASAAAGGYAAIRSSQAYQTYQGIQSGLVAATGSRQQAIKDFEYLVKLSKDLGTFIGDSSQSFMQLSAAAKGTTLEGEGVRGIFTAVSSYSRVLNLSATQMEGVYRGLTQTISKGQLYSEEVRGQIGEALPGFIQALARSTGYIKEDGNADVAALNKAMELGQIQAEDVYPELSEELMRMANAGGALEEAMNNTGAAFGRFRTNAWLANKTLNDSGFDKAIRNVVNQSSEAIVRAEPLWMALGAASVHLGNMLETPIELFGALNMHLPKVTEFVGENELAFKGLGAAITATVKPLRTLFLLFVGVQALSDLLIDFDRDRSMAEWAVQLGLIAGLLYALKGPLKMVGRMFGGILGTVTKIGTATSKIPKTLPGAAAKETAKATTKRVPGLAQVWSAWEAAKIGIDVYNEYDKAKDEAPKDWITRRAEERGIDVTVDSEPFFDRVKGWFESGTNDPLPVHSVEVLPYNPAPINPPELNIPKPEVFHQLNDSNIDEYFKSLKGLSLPEIDVSVASPKLDLSFLKDLLGGGFQPYDSSTLQPNTNNRQESTYNIDAPITVNVEGSNMDAQDLAGEISSQFERHFNSVLRSSSASQQMVEK
ncbi:tape measure protein [Halomonas sp. ATCH28]|uniref:Tape measure protein n=1 Tax=Halomonas gemina TaxID=2945105 RepID=A0ABT0T614_9GAMM|nr:tape measure protein [Halomonas gemina]MCL7942232.1 tape measure protein [Halomonas gemina]